MQFYTDVVAPTDISYQYTELRPVEDKEDKEEDEATLELTLEYDDLEPPPAKRPATEEEMAKERYSSLMVHTTVL